jgi:hypothetical protein
MSLHQCGAGISFPKKEVARRVKYMDPYWRTLLENVGAG